MASFTTPIPPLRADWMGSGACTSGSTALQRDATKTRQACGGADMTSTSCMPRMSAPVAKQRRRTRENSRLLPEQGASRRQRSSARIALAAWGRNHQLDRSGCDAGVAAKVPRLRGGLCGDRNRARYLILNRGASADIADDVVHHVAALPCREALAALGRAQIRRALMHMQNN